MHNFFKMHNYWGPVAQANELVSCIRRYILVERDLHLARSQEKLNFISTLLQIVKEYGDVGIYVYLAGCSGEYISRMGRSFNTLVLFLFF